jgi:hypothetical protein
VKEKDFITTEIGRIHHHQQIYPVRNFKRSSSRKRIHDRSSDLHKEMKNVGEGINEGKISSFVLLTLS